MPLPEPMPTAFPACWTVDDPATAELLVRPESFRFLSPFLGRAVSASQAAAELGVSLPRLRYWLLRAQSLGLVVTVKEEQRRGRTVKLLRTRADALYLPAAQTVDGTLEHLATLWSAPWDQVFMRNSVRQYERAGVKGLRLFRDARGNVDANLAYSAERDLDRSDPRLAPTMGGWIIDLKLTTEEARELQAELAALKTRYLGRGGPRRFMMRLALSPLDEGDRLI